MRGLDAIPRLAEFSIGAAKQAGSLALSVVRAVAAPVLGRRRDDEANGSTRNDAPPRERPVGEPPPTAGPPRTSGLADPPATAPSRAARPQPVRPEPAPEPPPPAPEPEPAHVDRDAVVVAESADAGAADGAGAQIRVDEPWSGYGRLNAKDVIAQLATADGATLAVVRLYESTHRKRSTVLAEIDRRLAAGGN